MTGMSKCAREDCNNKMSCWRYIAPSTSEQRFLDPNEIGDKCLYYWQINQSEVTGRHTIVQRVEKSPTTS